MRLRFAPLIYNEMSSSLVNVRFPIETFIKNLFIYFQLSPTKFLLFPRQNNILLEFIDTDHA